MKKSIFLITILISLLTIVSCASADPAVISGRVYNGMPQTLFNDPNKEYICTSADDVLYPGSQIYCESIQIQNAGTYLIDWVPSASPANPTKKVEVTIAPKPVGVTWTDLTKPYAGGTPLSPTAVVNPTDLLNSDVVTTSFTFTDENGTPLAGDPTDGGAYTATVVLSDTNYAPLSADESRLFYVTKVPSANPGSYKTEPQAIQDLVYDGTAHKLVNEAGECQTGTIMYRLDDETLPFTSTRPTGTNAGNYKVYYRCEDTNEYYPDTLKMIETKIDPVAVPDMKLSIDPAVFINNTGQTVTPNLVVTGTGVSGQISPSDWVVDTASSVTSAKESGLYTVNVKGTGNYTGNASAKWMIYNTFEISMPSTAETGQNVLVTLNTDVPNLSASDITWKFNDDSLAEIVSASGNQINLLCKKPGILTVTASIGNFVSNFYNMEIKQGTKTEIKESDIRKPTYIPELEYTGSDQKLLIDGGYCSYGTMKYRLNSFTPAVQKSPYDWSNEIPVGNLPGIYVIDYYVEGDITHYDSAIYSMTVEIKQSQKGDIFITLDRNTFIYDGDVKQVSYIVIDSAGNPLPITEWELDPASVTSASNPGIYAVMVKGKNNHSGISTAVWTIGNYSISLLGTAQKGDTITAQLITDQPNVSVNWSLSDNSRGGIVSVSPDGKTAEILCKKAGVLVVTAEIDSVLKLTASVSIKGQPDPAPSFYSIFQWIDDEGEGKPCLPETGFSTRFPVRESLNAVSVNYQDLNLSLMIPTADVTVDLVSVPVEEGQWPVKDLQYRAGILSGSELPGEGYSLIVAHNHLSQMEIGPFLFIRDLQVNDRIFVGNEENLQRFAVYENILIEPDDIDTMARIAEQEPGALVLATCENETLDGSYANRRVIFAKPL